MTTKTLQETDPRFAFAKAVQTGTELFRALQPADLDKPTPCGDFDVRGLAGHLVEVLRRVADLGRGLGAFEAGSAVAVADDELLAAWLEAAHDVQSVWSDDAVLERQITLPWSDRNGGDTLRTSYVNEVLVHTWDLAQAIGFEPAWDERALAVAFEGIQEVLPADRKEDFEAARAQMPEDMRDFPDPFAPPIPVAADAPLIDKLVAWNGRTPR